MTIAFCGESKIRSCDFGGRKMKLTGVIMSLIAAAVLSAGDFPLQELFEKIQIGRAHV